MSKEMNITIRLQRNIRLEKLEYILYITDVYPEFGIPFTRVRGMKGSTLIIDDLGYKYSILSKQEETKEIKLYRCCKRSGLKCKASVKIQGDFIVVLRNEHNHSPPEK